eukprot:CAMPEP_0183405384 /NCGR_PEP_ID=MMETSP0370-20130417/15791_1 /TAXON_ID=268820 /ORGANISM="Peridinium aciculiferum, Strain PAER-2" /LENGTH=147 /DNA_ID=CAMNT_0025587357 /DNA_START=103 /DNA_END=542 /DNA_ORIENTATION=-
MEPIPFAVSTISWLACNGIATPLSCLASSRNTWVMVVNVFGKQAMSAPGLPSVAPVDVVVLDVELVGGPEDLDGAEELTLAVVDVSEVDAGRLVRRDCEEQPLFGRDVGAGCAMEARLHQAMVVPRYERRQLRQGNGVGMSTLPRRA